MLYQWYTNINHKGYNGLVESKRTSNKGIKNEEVNKSITFGPESEREELIRLRAENEYIKAEMNVIKKTDRLEARKWAANSKAKKQQSSKTQKTDTN